MIGTTPMRIVWSILLLCEAVLLSSCKMQSERGSPHQVKYEPAEYCEILQEDAPPTLCRRYAQMASRLETGVAAFNPPAKMNRGETVVVQFAVARAADRNAAVDMVTGDKSRMQRFEPKIGRFMTAELTGEGFEIVALRGQEQDLFLSGAGLWEWQVKALKGDRHILKLAAWVKMKLPDNSLKPLWFKTVNREVEVPVRFFPDRIEDFLDATQAWFARLETWVKALAALVTALAALWVAVRYFGRKKPAP